MTGCRTKFGQASDTCYSCPVATTPPKGTHVNEDILNALDEEIARLREARALLAGSPTTAGNAATKRRTLTPKARRAIAEAQRKRWAKARRQKKATT